MKIGQLAKSTSLSVRTLHHYDEIGLLKPSNRSESDHRLYSQNDVARLHRILALKQLGLSLNKIGEILGQPIAKVQETLERNLEKLENEIEQKKNLLRRLKITSEYISLRDEIELPELMNVIKDLVINESYFNQDQWDQLEQNEKKIGKESVKKIINELPKLIQQLQKEKDAGTDPSANQVTKLIKRWKEIVDQLIGDNQELKDQATKLHQENPEIQQRHGINPELMAYIRQVKEKIAEESKPQ